MSTFKKVPSDGQKGKISYNSSIVEAIVSIAVSEISGVTLCTKGRKTGIRVNFEKDGIFVDVSVNLAYGHNVPDVAYRIQESVKHNVEAMSEFKITKVDVHVNGVIFPEEANA